MPKGCVGDKVLLLMLHTSPAFNHTYIAPLASSPWTHISPVQRCMQQSISTRMLAMMPLAA